MPVERVPLVEMLPDQPGFGARNGASQITNLLPLDGRRRPVKKLSQEASKVAVFEPPIGALYYPGRSSLILGTTTALANLSLGSGASYLYEVTLGATHTITDRSRAAGYGGGIYDWSMTLFQDVLVATSFGNPVQYIDTGASLFANLISTFDGATPPNSKYCCTSKTHLVLANIRHDGVNYPRRVAWSATGDATDFQASATTRSGIAEIDSAAGDITGCVGFEEFFLVFTETKVIRFNWVGGTSVWFPQEVAAGSGFGMDEFSSRSIVRVGTDTVYRGREGYKIIGGDGSVGHFGSGKIRSIVRDPAFPVAGTYGFLAPGAVDEVSGLVYWIGQFYPSGAAPDEGTILAYNPSDDRYSVLNTVDLGLTAETPFPRSQTLIAYAPPDIRADGDGAENMLVIHTETIGGNLEIYRFSSATYAKASATSRLIEPVPGSVSSINRVRPVIELEEATKTNVPTATVDVTYYNDTWRQTTAGTVSVDTDTHTDNEGWLVGALPLHGGRVELTLTISEIASGDTYVPIDVVGVDVDFESFSEK